MFFELKEKARFNIFGKKLLINMWLPWLRQQGWTRTCYTKLFPDKCYGKFTKFGDFSPRIKKVVNVLSSFGKFLPPRTVVALRSRWYLCHVVIMETKNTVFTPIVFGSDKRLYWLAYHSLSLSLSRDNLQRSLQRRIHNRVCHITNKS